MMEIANHAVTNAIALTRSYDEKLVEEIKADEHQLDQLEDSIGTYLVKLSARSLSREDSQRISKMLHALGDFERMGDHAMNLSDVAIELHEKKIFFSEQAVQEIAVLADAVQEIMSLTMAAYSGNNVEIAAQVEPLEEVIDGLNSTIKNNHINRLQHGDCTIEMGFILADLLQNFERISDHCSNVAVAVIELVHNSFDTHKYLNDVKFGSSEFARAYQGYGQKYRL
jgi:phosphate:Na+ symporter